MLWSNPLMAHANCHRLGTLQEPFGAVGKFFEVHWAVLFCFPNTGSVAH